MTSKIDLIEVTQYGKLQSRKLWITVGLLAAATVAGAFGFASFDQWADFSIKMAAGYSLANVGEHYVSSRVTRVPFAHPEAD